MIDFGWLGVLYVDRDIALATTIDLATGGRDMNTVRHVPAFEFLY
jgi:hypothetical protein